MTAFSPFEVLDGDYAQGLLLIADHASRAAPENYGTLGLSRGYLSAILPMISAWKC